jgi:hypothetical protein
MLNLLLAALALAASDSVVYDGRGGRLDVPIPRHEAGIEVDGRLDEPQWAGAAVLTGFSGYLPVDGRPAEDRTEVLVWYSPSALHVGIRAHEAHGPVRATLADRDRLDGEDHVQVLLDTFGDRRQAYVLAVNPLGVQADGIRMENEVSYKPLPGLGNVDLSTDLVFQSRGRVTDGGYEVELRIPFKSIRYGRGVEEWGINVVRQVQHSGHQDTWAPVHRSDASFLGRSGAITGLRGIRRGLSLDLNPVLTSSTAGARDGDGWSYETRPELGGNVRWGVTPDLTVNGTVRPDFSQVEADAGQIPGDTRYAVYFPERRPFFVDGGERFAAPNRLLHTRRIVEPVAAAKLTGRLGGTEVGFLSAVDDAAQSRSGDDRPLFHALRLRRGIGENATLGVLLTDRTEHGGFNRVASVDGRLAFGGTRVGFQAAGSATGDGDETAAAPLWWGSVSHSARRWDVFHQVTGIHPEFRADAGFVDRTDKVQSVSYYRLNRFGRPGALAQSWSGRLVLDGTWLYDGFFERRAPLETKVWLEGRTVLRGGWDLILTRMFESFAFDPREYAHYRVTEGAGADTAGFRVSPRRRTGGWWLQAETPKFGQLSAGGYLFYGLDPYFPETRTTRRFDVDASVDWTPSERVRVNASYAHSEFVRREDGSTASVLDIPRLKLEYQVARPLFLRLVGQYQAQETDALRDPRTEAPILLPDGAGGYAPSTRRARGDLQLDWLVSYQPSPGTVVFVGYGSSLTGSERLRWDELERTRDGLFVKLSYVFRS